MFFSLWAYIQTILIFYPHGGDTIYHGTDADFNKFNYMVCIAAITDYFATVCGGAIIDESHIITAAHCVHDMKPEYLIVTAGRPQKSGPFSQSWGVEKIYVHPNFNDNQKVPRRIYYFKEFLSCIFMKPNTCLTPKNDIALLKLIRALPLGEHMTKVELPKSDSLPYCHLLNYAGWGHTEAGPLPEHLQSTNLMILNPEECMSNNMTHRKSQFCTLTVDRLSRIAMGDSGNPLVDRNILYGITSFIPGNDSSIFGGFTKVFNYIHFINTIINPGYHTSDESDL